MQALPGTKKLLCYLHGPCTESTVHSVQRSISTLTFTMTHREKMYAVNTEVEQVFCPYLQANHVPTLPELLLIELSLLFLCVLHSDIVVGVETFGLGLHQKNNSSDVLFQKCRYQPLFYMWLIVVFYSATVTGTGGKNISIWYLKRIYLHFFFFCNWQNNTFVEMRRSFKKISLQNIIDFYI